MVELPGAHFDVSCDDCPARHQLRSGGGTLHRDGGRLSEKVSR